RADGLPINAPVNVYAETLSWRSRAAVSDVPERVYVPNSGARTVDVIDPATFEVVEHFRVGDVPHHITPSWDMTRLYVDNTASGTLTEIDPKTSRPIRTIPVPDPYNLYFTVDGSMAIVVAERYRRLDFRDPHTWSLIKSVAIPWSGVDHLDLSADGRYLLASTEFSGFVVKVDIAAMEIAGHVDVGGKPIDVRLAPDGSVFYVANQGRHGVSIIDPILMQEVAFLPTGPGSHGLQVSRDAKTLYVTSRLAGTISVIDLATRQIRDTWIVGGSPDMLQVSPDGRQLWVSNRFSDTVSIIDAVTGQVLKTVRVGRKPHGLAYFPQPGRFSLGHNGVYR
ncbi:MAG TPA: beta-propeller fold lactonase family protein, partial [Terrimicrobiaceae bacterium]|nr:beta-propeller fold lactonase family protein [Terrimicrobiaceae bacterium]